MPFTPPDFNLTGNWYQLGNDPNVNPPDLTTNVQLYTYSKFLPNQLEFPGPKFAAGQEVRMAIGDYVALGVMQTGSIWGIQDINAMQWYYLVLWWDACHRGFPNEYLMMIVTQCDHLGVTPDAGR